MWSCMNKFSLMWGTPGVSIDGTTQVYVTHFFILIQVGKHVHDQSLIEIA